MLKSISTNVVFIYTYLLGIDSYVNFDTYEWN